MCETGVLAMSIIKTNYRNVWILFLTVGSTVYNKATRRPGFPRIVPDLRLAFRCPGKVCRDAYFILVFINGHLRAYLSRIFKRNANSWMETVNLLFVSSKYNYKRSFCSSDFSPYNFWPVRLVFCLIWENVNIRNNVNTKPEIIPSPIAFFAAYVDTLKLTPILNKDSVAIVCVIVANTVGIYCSDP